jgi:hypothetical protein
MAEQWRKITSAPSASYRNRIQVFVYVSDKALAERETIRVLCDCNARTPYQTASHTNICTCQNCSKVIGIWGISGGPGKVPLRRSDGDTRVVSIQGFDSR